METSVKIVSDSLMGHTNSRITSFEVVFPRFILAEVNTHRIISKSSASSRAIPLNKRIADVRADPFVPLAFTKNKPGMVADEVITEQYAAQEVWLKAAMLACDQAEKLSALGVHKQHASRILEPFMWQRTILTGTEWKNFFTLRTAWNAQPEFQELANKMLTAYNVSSPEETEVHLPYVTREEKMLATLSGVDLYHICAARCARVSYINHDNTPCNTEKDLELAKSLETDGHMSPFDHPAFYDFFADRMYTRQYTHWIPFRTLMEMDKTQND